jgi:hypothetical protein
MQAAHEMLTNEEHDICILKKVFMSRHPHTHSPFHYFVLSPMRNRPSTGGGVTRQACQRIAYTDFGEDVTGIGGISFDLAAQAIDIHL